MVSISRYGLIVAHLIALTQKKIIDSKRILHIKFTKNVTFTI